MKAVNWIFGIIGWLAGIVCLGYWAFWDGANYFVFWGFVLIGLANALDPT